MFIAIIFDLLQLPGINLHKNRWNFNLTVFYFDLFALGINSTNRYTFYSMIGDTTKYEVVIELKLSKILWQHLDKGKEIFIYH